MRRMEYGRNGNGGGHRALNLFDLSVLAVLTVALCLGLYFAGAAEKDTAEKAVADCILFATVTDGEVPRLQVGDEVYDRGGNSVIGKVTAIETAPCRPAAEESGESVTLMRVTVRMEGVYTERRTFTVNGRVVRVGDSLPVSTTQFYSETTVADIVFPLPGE